MCPVLLGHALNWKTASGVTTLLRGILASASHPYYTRQKAGCVPVAHHTAFPIRIDHPQRCEWPHFPAHLLTAHERCPALYRLKPVAQHTLCDNLLYVMAQRYLTG